MIAVHPRPATPAPPLLIAGASARAAAQSVLRAGSLPLASDLFNDLDLPAGSHWQPLPPFDEPSAWPAWEGSFPDAPWIYTGGLENQPAFVDWLASRRPLLGNSGAPLRASRDPFVIRDILARAGLPAPEVRDEWRGLPADGSWVRKPTDSSGGARVAFHAGVPPESQSRWIFQEYIRGTALSALFIATGRGARPCGVTRQLLGIPGHPFAYRGSIGPWPVPPETERTLQRIGDTLAGEIGLIGLFGVDFVLRGSVPYPIEINPRYTASVEVIELARGVSLLGAHRDACEGGDGDIDGRQGGDGQSRWVGKEVLFADRPRRVPCRSAWPGPTPKGAEFPDIADLPRPETTIRAGDPIFTVLAAGDDCRSALRSLVARKKAQKRAFDAWPLVHEH
jgi:predicted ATP-grasp superfamily ATP-dependent carboligase